MKQLVLGLKTGTLAAITYGIRVILAAIIVGSGYHLEGRTESVASGLVITVDYLTITLRLRQESANDRLSSELFSRCIEILTVRMYSGV
jgi:hypothetical protein